MQTRKLILAVLAGGPLLGILAGLAADPDMVPAAEPPWRKARPDPIFTESQRFVDAGPQDLSPWSQDRLPSWKRRALAPQAVSYAPPEEPAPIAEPVVAQPAVAERPSVAVPPPAEAAAAAQAAAAAAAAREAPDSAITLTAVEDPEGA